MAMLPQIVFIQNSAHLAGAQKSLSRLLTAPGLREYDPVLLTGEKGWLYEHCGAHGVRRVCLPFPASRSLAGRLWRNRLFAKKAAHALKSVLTPEPGRPVIVHANDHPDSLLGLWVAKELGSGAVPVLTLRTPGIRERDFVKYGCAGHAHLIAVGDELFNKVRPWLAGRRPLTLVHNGVTEEEILSPMEWSGESVDKVLVLGSIIPRKGWQDLVEALLLLEKKLPEGSRSIPLPQIHLLGDLLGQNPEEVLNTARLKLFRLTFIGVAENYRERLRQYALAVHPSRSESFGMAALECVAAGVPLVAAATGLIPEFITSTAFLFEPGKVEQLAAILEKRLLQSLAELREDFDFAQAHSVVRDRFSTPGTVNKLKKIYAEVCALPK